MILLRFYIGLLTDFTGGNYNIAVVKKKCLKKERRSEYEKDH